MHIEKVRLNHVLGLQQKEMFLEIAHLHSCYSCLSVNF